MARRPSLSDADMPRQVGPQIAAAAPAKPSPQRSGGRQGKRGIAFWVSPEAFKQLNLILAEEDRTVQSIMEEALDHIFQTRGKQRIASTGSEERAA